MAMAVPGSEAAHADLGTRVAQMRAGEAFGEKSALCRTPRSASCVAVHETVLVSIDRLGFHTTLASEYMASLQKKLDCFKVHQLEVHTRFNNLFYERSFPAGAWYR